MKKILIFSLAYYPSFVSGAEAAIKEITDRNTDISFHLVTLLFDKHAPRVERIGNVEVHRVGFGGNYLSKMLYIPLAALKARSLNRKEKFDALWSVMTYMLLPVVLAKMIGVRAPHVLTLQDGDPYEKVFQRWFIRPIVPLLDRGFKTAAIVQVISSYLGTWPAKRGYKGEVVKIYNGANPRDIKESVTPEEVEAIHTKFNKQPGQIWLTNTARLVHQKGWDDTIRALKDLPEHVRLVVVGAGPDEAMLKNLAKELGIEDRVIFAGGVDRSQVSAYRKAADIFVGPSRSEGLGNAFLSAMASRIPVVTTREGGIAEFAFGPGGSEPQTAWIVRKDSPEDIRDAVLTILTNPEQVPPVLDAARARVLESYNWDLIATQMRSQVFERAFNGGSSGAASPQEI